MAAGTKFGCLYDGKHPCTQAKYRKQTKKTTTKGVDTKSDHHGSKSPQ
jgi:hypothetical protein